MSRFTRSASAAGVALLLVGCGKRVPAAGPDAAREDGGGTGRVGAENAGGTAKGPIAAEAGASAGAEVPAFLLVEVAGRRGALVLLDEEAPPRTRVLGDGGVPVPELLAESPVVTTAMPLSKDQLSEAARARLAARWVVGGLGAKAPTCTVASKMLVDVSRILADDPTLGEGTKGTELAVRAFANGSHAYAAIVDLPASCGRPTWAVREGTPLPRHVPSASLDRAATARLEGFMARASERYKELPKEASLEKSFEAMSVGDGRAWVRALRAEPGSPSAVCALIDVAASPPKILAETSTCPGGVSGVTQHGADVVVWAGAGALRIHGSEIEAAFFPTASFVPYGAP